MTSRRAALERGREQPNVGQVVQNDLACKAGIHADVEAPTPPPNRKVDEASWTSISVQVSSTSSKESEESSATSLQAEVSYSNWFVNASASVSHQSSQSAAMKELANATIRISFECMRVDINRPWLRAELFFDHDLRLAEND